MDPRPPTLLSAAGPGVVLDRPELDRHVLGRQILPADVAVRVVTRLHHPEPARTEVKLARRHGDAGDGVLVRIPIMDRDVAHSVKERLGDTLRSAVRRTSIQ